MSEKFVNIGNATFPTLSFSGNQIESVICENAVSISGDELSSDVLEVSVFYNDENNILRNTEYATPIYYYLDDVMVGKYYVEKIIRKASQKYEIRATSVIGLIGKEQHYGGMYNNTFKQVVNDILYGDGINTGRYDVYESFTSVYGTSTNQTSTVVPNVGSYSSRIHVDFKVAQSEWSDSTTSGGIESKTVRVCGVNYYRVDLMQRRSTTDNVAYHYIRVRHGTNTDYDFEFLKDENIAGDGSRFVVDVDPLTSTVRLEADCVDPWSGTVRHIVRESSGIRTPLSPITFSATTFLLYGTSIQYNRYQLFNGGKMEANFVFVKDNTEVGTYATGLYIYDTVTGRRASTASQYTGNNLVCSTRETRFFERAVELQVMYGDDVDALNVQGWIAPCTKREALHHLLLSQNIRLIKTSNGDLLFTTIAKDDSGTLNDNSIYNTGSVEDMDVAKSIKVTEHSYVANGTSQTIFDNSDSPASTDEYVVLFDNAPVYGTPVAGTGVTIIAYNCNAAIITGRGIITGTPYIHSRCVRSYENPNAPDGIDVAVSDVGLITDVTSDNVMSHLKAYYCAGLEKITNDIIYSGERCGLKYSFISPFLDSVSANLAKASLHASSFIKAACEFIKGYVPTKIGGYQNYAIQTSGDTWTVPADVKAQDDPKVRLILIGRGTDGEAGTSGTNGQAGVVNGSSGTGGTGGAGGEGGDGGAGGNIYIVTVDVTNVTTISVTQTNGNIVVTAKNGNVTVATYTSESGSPSQNGFTNSFTGIVYALPGTGGVSGGKGGNGGVRTSISGGTVAQNGADVSPHSGGKYYHYPSDVEYETIHGEIVAYYYGSSGGGGGASYTEDGQDSYQYGTVTITFVGGISETMRYYSGGNGANGGAATEGGTTYGCGGNGGNGGGGGGGGAVDVYKTEQGNAQAVSRQGGRGGYGGSGGTAKDGCLIIYY